MKKASSLFLVSSVVLGLAGCATNSDSSKSKQEDVAATATQKETSKAPAANSESSQTSQTDSTKSASDKETKANPVMFEKKEVKQIEITPAKTKITKTFTKEDDMMTFVSSIEHSTKKTLLFDKKASDNVDCKMRIKYQDGSSRTYFIWLESQGKPVTIAYQKTPNETHIEDYLLTKDDEKQIIALLKNQDSSKVQNDKSGSTKAQTQDNELDIREAVWNQLPQKSKDEVIGTWKEATIKKITVNKDMGRLNDVKYDGKEVYLIAFKSNKNATLGPLSIYADMQTEKIVGFGNRN
ncbi:hypothetical protein [Ectobacillus panaciterrae]|uniref:hypothetical protein n=1 Tax=Ectobacillus panaciterrae TaxID=363872 RepID=UPI0003F8DE00|nr:hypothetical protein [Ectobacillus panaciterrae]